LSTQTFNESLRLLRTRRFGTFVFASLLSNIGTWAQQVAQPWLLLSLGASSFVVGLDAFAQGAPAWMLTIVGGVLADRSDRRRVIVTFQSIQMLCPLVLVVLIVTGTIAPWMVVVVSLIVGITDALSMPSFQSIVPSIVEHKQIGTALALNSSQFNLSRILGPAIAGVLMVGLGAVGCFAVNAASYIPFLMVAIWILPKALVRHSPVGLANWKDLLRGVGDAAREPQLRGVLLTVFFTSLLCGPLITFVPVLVRDVFNGDAARFSMAVGAFGIGGLAGAVTLLFVDGTVDRSKLSSWFALIYGAAIVIVAMNAWFIPLLCLLALAGLSMSISNTSANTLAQSIAPIALRGQTVSLYMLSIRGGMSMGALLTGISVSAIGIRQAFLLNGVMAIVAQLLVMRGCARPRSPPGNAPPEDLQAH
jgi:MFS family permease